MLGHTEFASTEPSATQRFLEKVFHWSFETRRMPQGDYLAFQTPGGGRGGIRPTQAGDAPSTTNYVIVDDLDATIQKVQKAGGQVVLPRVDVPGMGSFFWFKVPGGPVLAGWQDAPGRGG
ncbi:MAG: uncharacterized protein QOI63_747 [Thermoplasmata archaeon]|nr:uncharacterized protein [Thermoplasmata archaeon]